jgi:thioredoxin-related protein
MSRGRGTALQSGLLIALFCFLTQAKAQQQVQFSEFTFDQAMASAKKSHKVIFVNVSNMNLNSYHEKVVKEVFTADSIAKYFNQHIIAINMPMHTEEGKKFAPRLAMLMYPAYVFYDSEGNQLEFTNPGTVSKDAGALLKAARASVASAALRVANKKRITFDTSRWAQVLQRAKKENKMIFVDAYTTWCRPCIMMAKNVFTLDTIANYFNTHFINVTMEMETGDGPALGKKYGVKAYPTFLFIDGDGKLVHTDGGYKEAPEFIKVGEAAVKAKTTADKAAGIQFKDTSWSAMLAEAKQTGKLIFMDAHTTWCGPCKWMSANVFNTATAGNLYNRNFINAYTDMEKGEGIELRKKYNVKAYPTYLFINGDGEVVHRVVGSCPTAEFVQYGLDALSPQRNLLYLQQNYEANAGKYDFIKSYTSALQKAYDPQQASKITLNYFQKLDSASWMERDNWLLLQEYVTDVTSAPFQYLVNHQPAFSQLYGAKEVDEKIYSSFLAWPQQYVTYPEKAKPVLDEKGFQAFLTQVSNSIYTKKADVLARANLTIYFNTRNWDGYVQTVNSMLANKLVNNTIKDAEQLYSYADMMHRFATTDKKALQAAAGWASQIIETPGISGANKASYQELYAALLDQNGQQDLAKEVRKNINQQQLTEGQNGNPMKQMRIIPKQPS